MSINYKKIRDENKIKYGTDINRYGPVLLANLYSKQVHFIYEILQNAEDAKAGQITFRLFQNRLEVRHNGRPFNENDVRGICGLVEKNKENDLTQIGEFGIGFKSVYAYTNSPTIFSGNETFCIKNYVSPQRVEKADVQTNETLFVFPFDHVKKSSKQAFQEIKNGLQDIDVNTLLFLTYIKKIKWQTPVSDGYCSKSLKYYKKKKNIKKIVLKSTNVNREYLVIEKPINFKRKESKIEVAYKLGKNKKGKKIITKESNSELVVFFPTDKITYLNFIIQGPYKTTPNRENIPLENEQNQKIINETANLVADSLLIVKNMGFLDTNFLSILPINSEHNDKSLIYSSIYKKVKEKLISSKLLPTSKNKYAKANNSLLANSKGLIELLNKKNIKELFSKHNWLDINITQDLKNYFIQELNIKEINFKKFAEKITNEFLKKQSDKWIISFYKKLLNQRNLWEQTDNYPSILRTKPIIRLDANKHIAPFDDTGKIQVYLPITSKSNSKYKTVKLSLVQNKDSLKFLKELGLTKPNLFAEINEYIIPKYQADYFVEAKEYYEDFEKLLKAYKTISADKKSEFIHKLSEISFIDAVNNITGKNSLQKPPNTYFQNNDLKTYFNDYQSVYFVSSKLSRKFGKEKIEPFLEELGVEDKPTRIRIAGNLSEDEKRKIEGGCHSIYGGGDGDAIDYEYKGLENFIEEITAKKSFLLWELLLKSIERVAFFLNGMYSWYFRYQHNEFFDAKFVKTLRLKSWLIDKNNNFRKPPDITFSELSNKYNKEDSSVA